MSEEGFWLRVWGIAGSVLCVIDISACSANYAINKAAFENGYEARQLQGTHTCSWQKVAK